MPLKIDGATLKRIYKQSDNLLYAENKTGVPWEVIAAIWFRENSCLETTKIKGGPMQFDPEPSEKTLRELLGYAKLKSDAEREELLKGGIHDIRSAFVFAACFLIHKGHKNGVFNKDPYDYMYTSDAWKQVIWAYNGKAYGSADKSPYVMNGYDDAHKDMVLKGTINGKPVKIVDKRPGAFVVYQQLVGLNK